jgi:hypothetical protein
MGFSTQPCGPIGPGYGEKPIRNCRLEWPAGGNLAGTAVGFDPTGPRSASFWARIDRPTVAEAAMVAVCVLNGPENLYLGTDESGDTPELFVGVITDTTGQFPFMGRTWHHFGYRSYPALGRTGIVHELWIDGHFCLQSTSAPITAPFDRICLLDSTAGAQFCGSIQAVKLWEATLTPAQLIQEGRNPNSCYVTAGLFAFWRLSTSHDLSDRSGNGRTLAPTSPYYIDAPLPLPSFAALKLGAPILPPFEPSTFPS